MADKIQSPIKQDWVGRLIEFHETDWNAPRGYKGRVKMHWVVYKIESFDFALMTKCRNKKRNPMVKLVSTTSTASQTQHPDVINDLLLGARIKGVRLSLPSEADLQAELDTELMQ